MKRKMWLLGAFEVHLRIRLERSASTSKTASMPGWLGLQLAFGFITLIACTSGLSQPAQHDFNPADLPTTKLPGKEDPFWDTDANWPTSLTNRYGTIYRLQFQSYEQNTVIQFKSFKEARASGKRFVADYEIDLRWEKKSLDRSPDFNSGQVIFGPKRLWDADGTLRLRGFSYFNGLWVMDFLDVNEKRVQRIVSDRVRNVYFDFLFDQNGSQIAYSQGGNDTEEPYAIKDLSVIRGKPTTEREYIRLAIKMRKERGQMPETPEKAK